MPWRTLFKLRGSVRCIKQAVIPFSLLRHTLHSSTGTWAVCVTIRSLEVNCMGSDPITRSIRTTEDSGTKSSKSSVKASLTTLISIVRCTCPLDPPPQSSTKTQLITSTVILGKTVKRNFPGVGGIQCENRNSKIPVAVFLKNHCS